jgi:hypothetical protein
MSVPDGSKISGGTRPLLPELFFLAFFGGNVKECAKPFQGGRIGIFRKTWL